MNETLIHFRFNAEKRPNNKLELDSFSNGHITSFIRHRDDEIVKIDS